MVVGRRVRCMGMVFVWGLRVRVSILVFGCMVLRWLEVIFGLVVIFIRVIGCRVSGMGWGWR